MNTYSMAYVVKAHSSNGLPAGTIICYNLSMNNDILKSGEYLLCDGSPIHEKDYPDLYELLKSEYNPKYFYKDTKIRNFFRNLGFKVPRKRIKNENYTEGVMNLPDLQGQFVADQDIAHLDDILIRE